MIGSDHLGAWAANYNAERDLTSSSADNGHNKSQFVSIFFPRCRAKQTSYPDKELRVLGQLTVPLGRALTTHTTVKARSAFALSRLWFAQTFQLQCEPQPPRRDAEEATISIRRDYLSWLPPPNILETA